MYLQPEGLWEVFACCLVVLQKKRKKENKNANSREIHLRFDKQTFARQPPTNTTTAQQ